MVIRPLKILRSTKKAFFIEWFDSNHRGKVMAWVPKSQIKIEHYTGYIDDGIYKSLKITKV